MFERLAQEQIEKFAAEGITLSAADIIRLNDVAGELARAKDRKKERLLDAPRCRWCGGALFHEPTVQSELWMLEVVGTLAANDETWFWLLAFALAHADEPGFFLGEEMRDAKAVYRMSRKFQRSLACTRDELAVTVNWCRFGERYAEVKPTPKIDLEQLEASYRARLYADLAEAVALTGCDAESLRAMTCGMLDRAIRTAWEREGRTFKDAEIGRQTRAWYQAVSEIGSRLPRETARPVRSE